MDSKDFKTIIAGLIRGDRATQKRVFLRYHALVKAIGLRYARSNEDADEIVSDVFLKVFGKISTFKEDQNLEAWITRIAINTSIDKYRKKMRSISTIELHADLNDPKAVTEMDLASLDDQEVLPMIQNLPEKYRLVFNLYVFEERSHVEIAQELQIPVGTSKSCLARAKAIIRNHMEQTNQTLGTNE